MLPHTSRYHGTDIAHLETSDGRVVAYLRRRFVPPAGRFDTLTEHTVAEGDRLDNLAAHYLGDPEQFWRICDPNQVLHPTELEEVGRVVRITLPEGVTVHDRP